MKIIKKLLQGLFWLVLLALLVAPLGLIWKISGEEMKAYEPPVPPTLKQTAYGELMQAHRWDVADYLTVSGTWVSDELVYQELDCWNPWIIRWRVEPGAEIQEGQILGTYMDKDVVAKHSGILLEINASSGENAYLCIQDLEADALECRMDKDTLGKLKNARELRTEEGNAVSLAFASRVPDGNGAYTVRLNVEGTAHILGETEKNLVLLTGQVYRDALVLDARCVYQKQPGASEPWYARKVQADGTLLGEVEIKIGFRIGNLVCVSGVSEGEWFDSGYQAVVQSAYGSEAVDNE